MKSLNSYSRGRLYVFAFLLTLAGWTQTAHAQSTFGPENQHYLIAQTDPDEAYDPFTDYSEFDEESDEEADINFFRNGRFFTLGLVLGYRGFTGNFASEYSASTTYGLFLSYFFDLRFAFQLGYQTGDHSVQFATNADTYTGNVSLSALSFDLKYYLNTQNVTRGLADLNPYLLGGFSQNYRTYTISKQDGFNRDGTMGFDAGVGLEIPLMRKKAYLGIQATYHYVNFNDENKQYLGGTEKLEKTLSGDIYDTLVILGMNF